MSLNRILCSLTAKIQTFFDISFFFENFSSFIKRSMNIVSIYAVCGMITVWIVSMYFASGSI